MGECEDDGNVSVIVAKTYRTYKSYRPYFGREEKVDSWLHETSQDGAQLIASAIQQTLGGFRRHGQFGGDFGVSAVLELMQFHRGALAAVQVGDCGAHDAG